MDLVGFFLLFIVNDIFRYFWIDVYDYNLDNCVFIGFWNYLWSFIFGSNGRFLDENIEKGVFDILCFLVGEMESKCLGFI